MTKRASAVRAGLHTNAVDAINGSVETGITAVAAGTISTSYPLTADLSVVATAVAGSGVRALDDLAVGDFIEVANLGANAVNLFPAAAAYVINALAAGAAFAVAAGKVATLRRVGAINFVASVSA